MKTFVGIVKSLMRKAHENRRDVQLALLEYRNTPVTGLKSSPAQLLMSRRLKDKLTCAAHLHNPKIFATASQELKNRQEKQRYFYDQHVRNCIPPKFVPGDSVWMHDIELLDLID